MLLSIDWGQAIIRPSHVRGVQAVISEGTSVAVIVTFAKRERQRPCGVSTNRTAEKYEKRNSGTVSGSHRISKDPWLAAGTRMHLSMPCPSTSPTAPMIFNSRARVGDSQPFKYAKGTVPFAVSRERAPAKKTL